MKFGTFSIHSVGTLPMRSDPDEMAAFARSVEELDHNVSATISWSRATGPDLSVRPERTAPGKTCFFSTR
jgi:hypothetical protein